MTVPVYKAVCTLDYVAADAETVGGGDDPNAAVFQTDRIYLGWRGYLMYNGGADDLPIILSNFAPSLSINIAEAQHNETIREKLYQNVIDAAAALSPPVVLRKADIFFIGMPSD